MTCDLLAVFHSAGSTACPDSPVPQQIFPQSHLHLEIIAITLNLELNVKGVTSLVFFVLTLKLKQS